MRAGEPRSARDTQGQAVKHTLSGGWPSSGKVS